MITADQLVAHAVGDYIIQSHWMATEKTKQSLAAAVHALTYSLVFLVFAPSPVAFAVIFGTHFVIDRWRLARYVVWAKNWLGPWRREVVKMGDAPVGRLPNRISPMPPFSKCASTGYPPGTPDWLAVWLLIIADNVMHVLINGAALRWL
jgi:hypothetical protein